MVPMKLFIVVLVLCITTAYGRSEILRVSENRFCDSDVKNEAISYMNYAIDLLDSSKSYPDYGSIVTNIAKGKKTGQKDTTHGGVSSRAVDGLFRPVWGSNSCTHTSLTDNPYWWVDLGGDFIVTSVWIQNRADCCHERLNSAVIMVGNDVKQGMRECARQTAAIAPGEVYGFNCHQNTRGSYVKVIKAIKIVGRSFNYTFRYTDDVLSLNSKHCENYLLLIYPPKLEIKGHNRFIKISCRI